MFYFERLIFLPCLFLSSEPVFGLSKLRFKEVAVFLLKSGVLRFGYFAAVCALWVIILLAKGISMIYDDIFRRLFEKSDNISSWASS